MLPLSQGFAAKQFHAGEHVVYFPIDRDGNRSRMGVFCEIVRTGRERVLIRATAKQMRLYDVGADPVLTERWVRPQELEKR